MENKNKNLTDAQRRKVLLYSFIVRLFKNSYPTAIFFAIISVWVNSVNLCLFFSKFFYMRLITFVHIVFKFFKRFPKTFYSSTAVSRIIKSTGVFTSTNNVIPYTIKSRLLSSCKSVFKILSNYTFSLQTTTRFYKLTSQCSRRFISYFSTITNTFPPTTSKIIQHFQSSKLLSNQFKKFHLIFTRKGDTLSRMSPSLVLSH